MIHIPQRTFAVVALILFIGASIFALIRSEKLVIPDQIAVAVSEPMEIPNEITMVESVEEIEREVGYDVKTLKELPSTFAQTYMGYQEMDEGLVVRQTYLNRNVESLTLKQASDPSLLNNMREYENTENHMVNGRSYTMFMNGNDIFQVIWEEHPFTFSLTSQQTFSLGEWKYLLSILK